jgi:TonB-linked SusC/RagA family outer membrane protein
MTWKKSNQTKCMKFYNLLGRKYMLLITQQLLPGLSLPKIDPLLTKRIIMRAKITFVLLITLFLQIGLAANAQRINLSAKNMPLKSLFKQIGKQSGYQFLYGDDMLSRTRLVDIEVSDASLEEVLKQCFAGQPLTYAIVDKTIIIKALDPVKTTYVVAAGILRGKVTDDKGPMAGVNIVLKGRDAELRKTTDENGNYMFVNITPGVYQISYYYVGYTSQFKSITVEDGQNPEVNVLMKEQIAQLNELVVLGYGSQVKREVTGSIATITQDKLTKLSSANFTDALQGRAAGLQVVGSGGAPGAPARILVRGVNSISAGTDPLYIIDGMPVYSSMNGLAQNANSTPQSPMASINSNDIESIDVLKDAAATAIYGSRGANGVIIITTKSGKTGQGGFNVDYTQGISNLTRTAEDVGFVDTKEWFELVDQARKNSGLGPMEAMRNINLFPSDNVNSRNQITREQAENTQTDWFKELLRTGKSREVNLSANNSVEKLSFYTSLNYREDKGILKNNDFQRFTGRVNLDFQAVDNLKVGVRVNLSYIENDRVTSGGGRLELASSGNIGSGFSAANIGALPWYPIYQFENPGQYWNQLSINNPVAQTDPSMSANGIETLRGLGGVWAEYSIPWVKGLSLRTEGSFDLIQDNSRNWVSRDLVQNTNNDDGSSAAEQINTNKSYNYNLYAVYAKTIGNHKINITAGTEAQRTNRYQQNMGGLNLTGTLQFLGTPATQNIAYSGMNERYLQSYFARANYSFLNRYLFGLSFRRDGSSAFRSDLRYGNFAAVSAGWILSDETFLKSSEFINFMKLRASFGQTGNESIPGNLNFINYIGNRIYGLTEGGVTRVGTQVNNLPSEDVTWETTNSYDLGLDFGLFKNRISGSVVYYNRKVSDLLLQIPLPPSVGLPNNPNIWGNIGDITNRGFELNLTTVNLNIGKFKWSTSFNLTTMHNKVLNLSPVADRAAGLVMANNISKKGHPMGIWYLPESAGIDRDKGIEMIWERDASVFAATGQTVRTGAKIPATSSNLGNNKFMLDGKGSIPTYFGGVDNSFSYKSFDLGVLFTFSGGNYIYDNMEKWQSYITVGGNVLRKDIIGNTWTPEHKDAKYPQLRWDNVYLYDNQGNPSLGTSYTNTNNTNPSQYLYKGDFIRLRTVQIGYTLPASALNHLKMKGIRVYITGNNLLTFSDFPGYDPEVLGNTGVGLDANLGQGFIDNNSYMPQLKTYTIGLSAKF